MPRASSQAPLFDIQASLPNGLVYRPDFITEAEEEDLLRIIETLPMEHPITDTYVARRRIIHFGWGFDFEKNHIMPGPPLPDFLVPIARRIEKWMGFPRGDVVEALINEYPPGYGLGWHRDNEGFEHIIGISLGSWCRMRFRPIASKRNRAEKRSPKEIIQLPLERRSAYVMQRGVRWDCQHSVAPVPALRYSITFRTKPAGYRELTASRLRRRSGNRST
jgi:alkylated DNA repair dioxygenase AlkB